jgi:trans-aconitate methyltransferase
MMAPKMEARVVQELALRKTDRVLEVGTGSGYLTALLARWPAAPVIDPRRAVQTRASAGIREPTAAPSTTYSDRRASSAWTVTAARWSTRLSVGAIK